MFSCDHLSHPFQNDPGTSQDDRAPSGLLGNETPIDGRQLSGLLNYFTALAGQINFYNADLSVGSWKPFFANSLPFLLSGISSYSGDQVKARMAAAVKLFQKRPGPDGLQLLFLQSYYTTIYPLQQWSLGLAGSGLDLETDLQTMIRDRLVQPIRDYIRWMNTAVHCFGIQPLSVGELQTNTVWGLTADDLTAYEAGFSCAVKSQRSQLLAVQAGISGLVDHFTDVQDLAAPGAADVVNNDLDGLLTNNGQQDTPPHLALLFSFLKQFLFVQADLNSLPRKHLDFFFQQVLSLAPGTAVPDNAYVVFNIQKQLASYTLKGGTRLKAGKDSLGADVLFGVQEDVTLTQTQVASLRTVFVNRRTRGSQVYVEGVYMAPDATMADGVSKPFKDGSNAAWPALGAKQSLYTPPGAASPVDYPFARLGFILASKVLLMKEGKRKVHIQLACQWGGLCDDGLVFADHFPKVQEAISSRWLVITADGLAKAGTMGVTSQTVQNLTGHYLSDPCRKSPCGGTKIYYREQALVPMRPCPEKDSRLWGEAKLKPVLNDRLSGAIVRVECPDEAREEACRKDEAAFWKKEMDAVGGVAAWEEDILKQVFVPQALFTVSFSGEKAWITPEKLDMELVSPPDAAAGSFLWHMEAQIGTGQGAIAFYNGATLGEDFNTTDPLVKIQLNDAIKWEFPKNAAAQASVSCMQQQTDTCGQQMSAYGFFRHIALQSSTSTTQGTTQGARTKIQVTVCGVTSLVVQNDDNVLDGNKNFAPFGLKPAIVDFDVYPVVQPDKGKDKGKLNLVGPTFLIGSAEVFLKKWHQLYLNINWLGKPADFNEYYKAYLEHPLLQHKVDLDNPGYQVNLALLNGGNWYQEEDSNFTITPDPGGSIKDNNRPLFHQTDGVSTGFEACCPSKFQYSFPIRPDNFDGLPPLVYDPVFAPFTQFSTSLKNGFLRLTLEYQDFLHKIYPWVLSRQIIEQTDHKGRHIPSPNEPWTPMIQKGMSIDYTATAALQDISLIQLYPFVGTYNTVDIGGEPALFATFCNEGNLFVGLSGLMPGETLTMLFQLAEATGDSENEAGTLNWYFLTANAWQPLRSGFEILQDDTNALTTTGLMKFTFPDTISNNNTVLPSGQYWIMASLTQNTAAGSRMLSALAQAALTVYLPQPANDPQRSATPLAEGTIVKLVVPDSSVTKVNQPFESFGGSAPEASGTSYYVRVSEQMRHKGRAIQKWDYERLVLQQFPQLLRAKCINHSTALNSNSYRRDFPMSPGSILLAVLPDISQLAVADSLQPTVPASMLTAIETFLADRISAFVQVAARNPRYEPVDFCVTVAFLDGADPTVSTSQLTTDLQGFLAPWLDGDTDSFQFGQRLYLSDIVGFVESREYVASLLELKMGFQGETMGTPEFIDPLTPRSILVAGNIEVSPPGPTATGNTAFWKKRLIK
jgi:hypothetical protein